MPDLFAAGVMGAAPVIEQDSKCIVREWNREIEAEDCGGKQEMDCRGGDRRLRDFGSTLPE